MCVSLSLSLQPFYLPSLYLHSLINIFFKGTLTVYVTKEKNESWIVACHVNKTRQDLFALFIFSFHFIYACVCVCECVRLNVFACVCVCVCLDRCCRCWFAPFWQPIKNGPPVYFSPDSSPLFLSKWVRLEAAGAKRGNSWQLPVNKL